jgi:hypothetical protein
VCWADLKSAAAPAYEAPPPIDGLTGAKVKVTLEIESYENGTLTKIIKGEGELVPVGEKIAEMEAE